MVCFYLNSRYVIVSLVALAGIAEGCSSSQESSFGDKETDAGSVFPSSCVLKCCSTSSMFTLSGCRLDPDKYEGRQPASHASFLSSLVDLAAQEGGRVIEVALSEAELHRRIAAGPVMLLHASGHYHVLLGTVQQDNATYGQLVHGESLPFLVPIRNLISGTYVSGWAAIPRKAGGTASVPLVLGTSSVEMQRLWHTFGMVASDETLNTTIMLRNGGPSNLVLSHHVESSCSCAVTAVEGGPVLKPGEEAKLTIQLATGHEPANKQELWPQIYEQGSGASRRLRILLYANQPKRFEVVPSKLDFGTIRRNDPVTRLVHIRPVHTDPFRVLSAETNGLPFAVDITEVSAVKQPAAYRLMLTYVENAIASGSYDGRISLKTSSELSSTIEIPLHFSIPPDFSAEPSILSYGTVNTGPLTPRHVRLSGPGLSRATIKVITHPPGFSTGLERSAEACNLIVRGELSRVGVLNEALVVEIKLNAAVQLVRIPCVALVRSDTR